MSEETVIETTPNHSKSIGKKILIAILIISFIGVGIFAYIRYRQTHITTDDAFIRGHIHWIYPRIAGTVVQVRIDENQYVKKGQLLVALDPERYKIALARARAELAVAVSKLEEARVNVHVALSEVALNKAALSGALHDFERARLAYPNKAISKQAYDHYLTNYKIAEAKLLASQQRLKLVKDQIKTAEAQVKVCRDQIKAARLNLQYTHIRAPLEGYIAKKTVEIGNRVGPQAPMFAIVPLNDIWVEANYKENQLQNIKIGQKVRIKVESYPKEKLSGRVESIQAGSGAVFSLFPPENATGNWVKITQRVPVRIKIVTPPKKILRIGMSVETTILVK